MTGMVKIIESLCRKYQEARWMSENTKKEALPK
jgi:hypothetical protein